MDYNKISKTVGGLRKQWHSYDNMVREEEKLHEIFKWAADSLAREGKGQDERFQMPVAYTEGQRAEAVWRGKDCVVKEQLLRLAETARQATLYVMHDLLGWQAVPYNR